MLGRVSPVFYGDVMTFARNSRILQPDKRLANLYGHECTSYWLNLTHRRFGTNHNLDMASGSQGQGVRRHQGGPLLDVLYWSGIGCNFLRLL
jgi:hypothetical protein